MLFIKNIDIEEKASQYTFEISPQESIILSFECRGCEFIEFFPDVNI